MVDILNVFFTATIGILELYITISIVENNTWKRRKNDYVIEQLKELVSLLEGSTLKLLKDDGKYPIKELFTTMVQKGRDYIEIVNELIDLKDDYNCYFDNLKKNYAEFSNVLDYYDHVAAIDSNINKINQKREDSIHSVMKIIVSVYKSN